MKLRIEDLPTLENWLGDGEDSDNLAKALVEDLKDCIGDLQLLTFNFASDSEELEILNRSCRLVARVVRDIKNINCEAKAAAIISAAGLKTKKGCA